MPQIEMRPGQRCGRVGNRPWALQGAVSGPISADEEELPRSASQRGRRGDSCMGAQPRHTGPPGVLAARPRWPRADGHNPPNAPGSAPLGWSRASNATVEPDNHGGRESRAGGAVIRHVGPGRPQPPSQGTGRRGAARGGRAQQRAPVPRPLSRGREGGARGRSRWPAARPERGLCVKAHCECPCGQHFLRRGTRTGQK